MSHLNDPDFADHKHWCDTPFGPYLDLPDDDAELAYQCRLTKGHDGGHDCPAAREAGYLDPSNSFTDLAEIEKFLGEK